MWIRFKAGDWKNVILVFVVFVDAIAESLGESVLPQGSKLRAPDVLMKVYTEPFVVRSLRGPLWHPWMLVISIGALMVAWGKVVV